MPPHSSHLLQPLDVSCFQPLKHYYGQKVQEMMASGIMAIDKMDFLSIYGSIHSKSMSSNNIISGFKATGLVLLDSSVVLSKLKIKLKTPTPPSSSGSNQSFYLGKTPANLYQLNRQKEQLHELQNQAMSSAVAESMLGKVIKGAEIAMQNAVLLQDQLQCYQTASEYQKKKKAIPRKFIQDGGSLTVDGALQKIQEKEAEIEIEAQVPRQRRPPTCSNCNIMGHTRLKCPTK